MYGVLSSKPSGNQAVFTQGERLLVLQRILKEDRFRMTKENFPFIAAALGLLLTLIVFKGSGLKDDGRTLIPLLTLLLITEFGTIVTAIGAYFGGKHFLSTRKISAHLAVTIVCVLLCVQFVMHGLRLWPHS